MKPQQPMASEVAQLCKRYEGVLMRNSYSHPQLKSHECQITELVIRHSKVQAIAKQPAIVLYCKRFLFKTQLKVHRDAVPKECDLLCLALFDVQQQHQDNLLFKDYYLISKTQWDKAPLVQSVYKSLNLLNATKINLEEEEVGEGVNMLVETSTPSLGLSSSAISIEYEDREEEEVTQEETFYRQCQPFWLHEQMTKEHEKCQERHHHYLSHYIQFVLDFLMWRRYFKEDDALNRKSLRYYMWRIGTHHSAMTLLFMAQMVCLNGHEMSAALHSARKDCKEGEWFLDMVTTRLYQDWLEAEVRLFKEARWHKQLMAQHMDALQSHIAFLKNALPQSLWPTWFDYAVNQEDGVYAPMYWYELVDLNYAVKVEWLLKPEFDDLLLSLRLEKGYALLSPQLMQTVFMPLLYRCLLEDTQRYLFYVFHGPDKENESVMGARLSLRLLQKAYNYKDKEMKELNAGLHRHGVLGATSLYDLIAEVGNILSPIACKMVKKRPEFDMSQSAAEINAATPWYERHIQRDSMPDIEDLANKKLVPPCMRRIFTAERPHLGHNDRMNVAQYLIDLAYSKEEVVAYLCKGHEKDAEYLSLIENTYISFAKKKQLNTAQQRYQHHSFPCTSIINIKPAQNGKQFMRCVYAEEHERKTKSHPRHDYSKTEKDCFMEACGASLSRPLQYGVKHPIHYTLSQIGL